MAGQNRHRVGSLEGRLTHQHLVQHAAEAVLVGPAVHALPAEPLFRAHAVRGPDSHSGFGHLVASSGCDSSRNAEVSHQRVPFMEQDVFWLYVAMDNLLGMSEVEGVCYLAGE